MKKNPVNLNIFTIKFPITAIVSILHRISGAAIFLLLPVILYLFDKSLVSEAQFMLTISELKSCIFLKLIVFAYTAALIYHFIAGFRHIAMDLHLIDNLVKARISSWLVLAISSLIVVFVTFKLFIGA